MATTTAKHDLIDVVDLQPMPGEYLHCANDPMKEFDVLGVQVKAWFWYQALRRAVSEKWDSKCECCGHHIRYAHITEDENGSYHCFGRTCLNIKALGQEGERKLAYSERIEQKESGFVATFNAPQHFWDLPREKRPHFARPWKGKAMTRRGAMKNGVQWKVSVWGKSFEECLANCMELDRTLGIKLC